MWKVLSALSFLSLTLAQTACQHGVDPHQGTHIVALVPTPSGKGNGGKGNGKGRADALAEKIRGKNRGRSPNRPNGDDIVDSIELAEVVVGSFDPMTYAELLEDPEVASISDNCLIQLSPEELADDTVDSRLASGAWGLDRIDARSGRDSNYDNGGHDGEGAVVYILDTGIRITHTEFGGRASGGWSASCQTTNRCSRGWNYQGIVDSSTSCSSHGTHCASTAGGNAYGVANGVDLVAVQVLSCSGSGSWSGVMAGIQWAVEDAAKTPGRPAVISMSLGGGKYTTLNNVVNNAHNAGVNVVVAAGNENDDACRYSPGSASNAITVGATTTSDYRSSYSNYGSCLDIYAPGSSIRAASASSNTALTYMSGTSMACPHVAGAVAQLRAMDKTLTSNEVTEALKCAASTGKISNTRAGTSDFLYAGAGFDQTSCVGPGPPKPPAPPPPPPRSPAPPPPPPAPKRPPTTTGGTGGPGKGNGNRKPKGNTKSKWN